MADLNSIFASIEVVGSPTGAAYFARRIPGFHSHRLAKDQNGNPCLLLSVSNKVATAPIVLQNIELHHTVPCRILLQDGSVEAGTFSILSCLNADPMLRKYFLTVSGALLENLGQEPSAIEIRNTLNRAVELFHALSAPAKKSIQGLWAEIFLISQSRAPSVLIHSWHTDFNDRFDFSSGIQRLEVKSSCNRSRVHRFRLEQVNPPAGTAALIVSLFVEPAGGGVSIANLSDEIQARLANDPQVLFRFEEVVASSLGLDWAVGIQQTFDRELAAESMRFYDARFIPSVNPELPIGVTNVSFESDLKTSQVAGLSNFNEGLFSAARRR